jgi:hypothetical protein
MRYDHFSMLPEWAFQPRGGFRAGGMTLEGGSSGGGGSPQPTSTSQTTIPEYAQPYVERLLGKSEAASEAPYQTYGGERLVGATPEQQAARSGVAGLQQPGQFGAGTGLTTFGGLNALGAGQQYMGMATDPQAQQAFMSPYMQNVVDIQKQEAVRDAQKGQLGQNLAAARQGTYGGARQLLAGTERERNLQQNLAQIQATGGQKAFEAAQQAQQFGSQLGLQGAQAATQAGATLGQLGIGQQQSDLTRLGAQEQFGSLAQRDQQAGLDLAYQDFLAQQRYPYSQLGFMSDVVRGSGNLAGTGGSALYQAPPSTGSQLLGLASTLGGAYLAGGNKFFKQGGEVSGLGAVKNYQDGGEVIQDMIDVNKLTPEQIQDTQKTGARPDVPDYMLVGKLDSQINTLKMLQAQMAQAPQTTAVQDIRAEAQQLAGLDAIPVPDDYYMSEEQAAASGGIVALANGGMPMDPGMPYGLGYGNNMGYENGGIVAFQDGGDAMFGMTPMGEPTGMGLAQALDTDPARLLGARKLQLYPLMTPEQQAEFEATGQVPPSFLQSDVAKKFSAEKRAEFMPKKKETVSEKAPKKAPEPKVEVSDKTAKKIQKAEDEYEKYLRANMSDAEMGGEAYRQEAIGFALMKAGAKAMQGKSQYAMQNIGEAVDAGTDEYVRSLNAGKKDKKEARKVLAEYGLAKENLRIKEAQVAATRDTAAATREAALMGRMVSADQKQQEMANKIMEEYYKPGNPVSIPGTDNYKPPQLYLKRRLELIGAAGNVVANNTPVEGRTATAADFYKS